jgi:3-phosphoshikimate 1-carboxyvinyltransferase
MTSVQKIVQLLPVENVLVVGLGLIGGSFAKALKRANPKLNIIGFDRNPEEMALALRLGVIDEIAQDLAIGAQRSHVIMLAVPVKAMNSVLREMRDHIADQTIITDVGSVKGTVIDAVADAFGFASLLCPRTPDSRFRKKWCCICRCRSFCEA